MDGENGHHWDGVDRRQTKDRRHQSGWAPKFELSSGVIYALILQTITAVIWATNLGSDVKSNKEATTQMRTEMYTKEDARRDRELTNSLFENERQRYSDLERRVTIMETERKR